MTHQQPLDHRSTLDQIGQVYAAGMSLLAGNGVSDTNRDLMTRLAAMFGAKEFNYAKGGACLIWENDTTRGEWGVVGPLPNVYKRAVRAASKLNANSAIGATTIVATPAPNGASTTGPVFKQNDTIHIGDGTNGEIAMVAGVTATNIDLYFSEGQTGLLRAHSTNDPVYVVPTHYGAGNTLFIFSETGNFGGRYGPPHANYQRWFQEALRYCITHMRCAETFEPNHTALVFTGTWGAAVYSGNGSGSSAAEGMKPATAVNAAVTLHLPDNFPGGTVAFKVGNIAGSTGGAVWTATVDGSAWTINGPNTGTGNTLTTVATPTLPVNKAIYYCARLRGLTPGRHTIVFTNTTRENLDNYFDCFEIEAIDPPIVVMLRNHRLLSWDPRFASADYGHIRPTLTSQANPGATSLAVSQTPDSTSRQIAAATIPKAGEFISINPRTSLEEIRTVTSVTGASAPFTINFSGGGLANTHPVGTRVEMGMKDYDLLNVLNPWHDAVAAEYDDYVIVHDPEPYIHPQSAGARPPSGGPKSSKYFAGDAAHWNDEGSALVAQNIYEQLSEKRRVDARTSSRLQRPVQIPPGRIVFFESGSASTPWTNQPAALTEFIGATLHRQYADLSRYYESRIIAHMSAIGATNAKLRIQYSIDNGATWKHLHRVSNAGEPQPVGTSWIEPTAATDFMWGEIALGTALPANNAPKKSVWAPMYPEALMFQYADTLLLRVIGIGGDAVADPAFSSVTLELR